MMNVQVWALITGVTPLLKMELLKFFEVSNRCIFYIQTSFDGKTNFTKVHAPYEVILRNAEVMEMKPPVKEFYVTFYTHNKNNMNREFLVSV